MSQCEIATVSNPPAGSTDLLYPVQMGMKKDTHGPCNAWHYMGGKQEIMAGFGHINDSTREFISLMEEKLPKIDSPSSIEVGPTGYWDKVGEIVAPSYAQTTDGVGRGMFFVDNIVIMQRYLKGDTLIYYSQSGHWEHTVASGTNIAEWREKVQAFLS